MRLFHKHDWETIETTFAAPLSDRLSRIRGADAAEVERLIWGVTTVLVKCRICGKIKTFGMLGKIDAAS